MVAPPVVVGAVRTISAVTDDGVTVEDDIDVSPIALTSTPAGHATPPRLGSHVVSGCVNPALIVV